MENNEITKVPFYDLLEVMQDAVVLVDRNLKIRYQNKALAILLGYEKKTIEGSSIESLIPSGQYREHAARLSQVFSGKDIKGYQTFFLSEKGNIELTSVDFVPIAFDTNGVCLIAEIIRTLPTDSLARHHESLLAAIIEGSDDAIISKTLSGVITTWNQGATNIFGYQEEEAIGAPITILLPTYRLHEEESIINSIKRGEKIDHFHTTRLRKDGTAIDISLTVSPIRDQHGNIIGASKIARDITAQKKAEESVRRYSQKLEVLNAIERSITENLDIESIIQKVTDATTQITGAGFGFFFYRQLGEKDESCPIYTLSSVSPPILKNFSPREAADFFREIFNDTRVVRINDIRLEPKYINAAPHFGITGDQLPMVSCLTVPVISKSGNVIGGLFFGHTEPRIFKEEHEGFVTALAAQASVALDNSHLYKEIKDLNAKKDEFIALASHELKTPLTSMNGFLQLIKKQMKDDKNLPLIEKSLHQLKKLNSLISDLLDVSKIQSGKLQFNVEDFELGSLVTEIVENFQSTNESHMVECAIKEKLIVKGDKIRLEQVINNLINNGIKYSPGAAKVDVCLQKIGNQALFSVRDYGIGILSENMPQLFTQFYRVKDISRQFSGLGLGLYISKEIVERHGGKIEVTSEPEKGSTFSFTIPVQTLP